MASNTNTRTYRSRLDSGSDAITNDPELKDTLKSGSEKHLQVELENKLKLGKEKELKMDHGDKFNKEVGGTGNSDCHQCVRLNDRHGQADSVHGRRQKCWKCTRKDSNQSQSSIEDKTKTERDHSKAEKNLTDANQELISVRRRYRAVSNTKQTSSGVNQSDIHRRKSEQIRRLSRHDSLSGRPMTIATVAPTAVDGEITASCDKHAGKLTEYYCMEHSELLCSVCITLNHNECIHKKSVQYIPDFVNKTKVESELKETISDISELSKVCQTKKDRKTEQLTKVINMFHKIEDDIKEFRKQINEQLDRLEGSLLNELRKLRDKHTNHLMDVFQHLEETLKAFKTLNFELLKCKQTHNASQMFVTTKKTEKEIKRQKRESGIDLEEEPIDEYIFKPNQKLQDLLTSLSEFGTLRKRQQLKHIDLKSVGEINVRSKDDKKVPWITSLVILSDSRLVVTDYDNHMLKLIDISNDLVLSNMGMPSSPHAVAKLSTSHIAVTIPDRKRVLFVSVDNGELCLERSLQVKGPCFGIAALTSPTQPNSPSQLVITMQEPPRLCLTNLDGTIVREISNDIDGRVLFSCPEYVAVSPKGDRIYVSDYDLDSVTVLEKAGSLLKQFRNLGEDCNVLKEPKTVFAATDGYVYVCGGDSNNVLMLTEDCDKHKVILDEKDGMCHPVCFGEVRQADKTLIYINGGEHTLKVFKY